MNQTPDLFSLSGRVAAVTGGTGQRETRAGFGDLEASYRNLWKFYVFADTRDPELLAKIGEIARSEFPEAKSVYRVQG